MHPAQLPTLDRDAAEVCAQALHRPAPIDREGQVEPVAFEMTAQVRRRLT
ncbi:MAG: hypothetical protein WKF47_01300 [Geodermatophilaceae bacterium]